MIAAAAIRKAGQVWTLPPPARHSDVMAAGGAVKLPSGLMRYALADGEQGFVTSAGAFVDRVAAAQHAIDCGQIQPEPSATRRERGHLNHPPNLYTEDLW